MSKNSAPSGLLRPSAVPLWQQMATSLRLRIASGSLAPGARLPSETELGAAYRVSRITVRKAVEALMAEQLVVRTHGKGTFVALPVLRHDISSLAGIIDSITAPGAAPRTRIVTCAGVAPPPAVASVLGGGGEDVLYFRRLYELDDACFGMADVWIPGVADVIAAQADGLPAYAILRQFLHVEVARADVTIRAQRPDRTVLGHLRLPRAATVLCFERTSFCAAGRAREHTRFWVRPEHYEFSVSVDGPLRISSAVRRAA